MTFWANALSLTLRTEKTTFCPGSRPWRFITSERTKGSLEPSAPSIIPKPLRVNFLDDSYHFVSSPRARLFSFSIFLGHRLSKQLPYSLFFPACSPESDQGDRREAAFAFALSLQL